MEKVSLWVALWRVVSISPWLPALVHGNPQPEATDGKDRFHERIVGRERFSVGSVLLVTSQFWLWAHFRTNFTGDWDVHCGYGWDFDPCPFLGLCQFRPSASQATKYRVCFEKAYGNDMVPVSVQTS